MTQESDPRTTEANAAFKALVEKSKGFPPFLARYDPAGIEERRLAAMRARAASRISRQTTAVNNEAQIGTALFAKPLCVEPDIEALLEGALFFRENGKIEKARLFYIDAAEQARTAYDTMPLSSDGSNGPERTHDLQTRALHAETAFMAFVVAGEFEDAKILGQKVLEDPLVPLVFRNMMKKAIELFIKEN